jgi:acyl carrier protein
MSELPDFLATLPRERNPENARRWAAAYLAYALKLEPSQIEFSRNATAHGLDSVDAVVMASAMEEHFQVELDPGIFLEDVTLEAALAALRDDPLWQDAG